ncbi:MAG: MFS transporter [Gemmatimonadaceae bacterium]|nr:MFS transporter [Gloeobacterales cyanobacterium ES-bin-141]
MSITANFASLRNPVFARLYTAQTVNLIGDALTWVGLALLAFELAGENAAAVLSVALTLRVGAFVVLAPFAGVVADRFDRKRILVGTHLVRMVVVGLLPFVEQIWQLYALVLALNAMGAFFTPTYQATIPAVVGREDYARAIALSGATYQLLGVLGPGIAGAVAAWLGARQVFFLDALSFLLAAILILSLPERLAPAGYTARSSRDWRSVLEGSARLFGDQTLRYALALQLVAAVAGAQILVNTVGLIKGGLGLGNAQYGWVMAAFGLGATLSALAVGAISNEQNRVRLLLPGAFLLAVSVLPADGAGLMWLLVLWALAGAGESLINIPTQSLIAERTPEEYQGRVYGAHFAWSHLWWAMAYPLAGWTGTNAGSWSFLWGGSIALVVLVTVRLVLAPPETAEHEHEGYWHEHDDMHEPSGNVQHRHYHPPVRHAHSGGSGAHVHEHG